MTSREIDCIDQAITVTTEEMNRDWAHALQQAVEEHFPLADREWREWPCAPDVEVVCAWLKRLVEEIRADECAAILAHIDERIAMLNREVEKPPIVHSDLSNRLQGRLNEAQFIATMVRGRS